MKKILFLFLFLLPAVVFFFIATPAESRLSSYYSGDAVSYQKQIYVTSTNAGSLEVLKLNGNKLEIIADERVTNSLFNTFDDFFDAKFNIENNRLYIYAVSHYTVFKYELVADKLNLVNSKRNTYWEWYNRIDKFGDDLVVVSAKGIKIMNPDLEFVVTYNFKNLEAPYNLSGDNSRFFLNVNETNGVLEVFDKETQEIISSSTLEFKHEKGNRRAYQDAAGYIYVVDDVYTRKLNVNGEEIASFKHLDFQGFDVKASKYTSNVYFTNGVGVVKLDKDLSLKDYAWISNVGSPLSWAMGLKLVYNDGDYLVIFNNSNILVLDDDLNKVAVADASKEAKEYALENLFLELDKHKAAINSDLALSGGGFLTKENLKIYFNGKLISEDVATDNRGRFSSVIKVPSLRAGVYDIKVFGLKSNYSYSISFQVE